MTDSNRYSAEFLKSVRARLEQEFENGDQDLTFDEKEYQKYLSEDEYLVHYIKRKRGDLEATVSFLREILVWRKRQGVSDLTEKSFPKEFYDFGGVHVYGSDREGNVICHIRLRFFAKVQEIMEQLKKFVIFQMLKADELGFRKSLETGKNMGWILLFDLTGAGVANVDLEMANFLNSTLKNYFPCGQQYILSHNLPWLLNAIKTVVFTMLPAVVTRRIRFSNDKNIADLISMDQLPEYMGGTSTAPYPVTPRGVLTTSQMVEQGLFPLTAEEESRVQKYYEKVHQAVLANQRKNMIGG